MTSIDQGIPEVMCFRCGKIWADGGGICCPFCRSMEINPIYAEDDDYEDDVPIAEMDWEED